MTGGMQPANHPDARRWPVRGAVWLGMIALLVLVLGFGGWAMLARISGAVLAAGQVEIESRHQIVQHPDGGVVGEINLREGDHVEAGQMLMRLEGNLLRTELTIVEGQYFEILARRGRLEAERANNDQIRFPALLTEAAIAEPALHEVMAGQTSLFEARRNSLAQSLEQLARQEAQISAQVTGIEAQIIALKDQRQLIGRELKDTRQLLDKGLAQASRVLALEREAARLDGQLGELAAARAGAEAHATEINVLRLRQGATWREEAESALRDLDERELELAERRRALTDRIARLDIRAPISGTVHELAITAAQSVIRPAEPILYLIPQEGRLIVIARISVMDIDQVAVGQPVNLRFSSFSQRTTPEIEGELTRISADSMIDEATRLAYYRAEITIPESERARLGELTLIPGMPVEVFIRTGEQSPMQYLLKPFTDYLSRAMRES